MTGRKAVGILGVAAMVMAASAFGGRILLAQKSQDQSEVRRPTHEAQPPDLMVRGDWFGRGEGAWLGITIKDVTADNAREMKLPGEYGAIVERVTPDSPAAKAGLETNDVILEFAGERVRSVAEFERLVRETPPGRTVSVEISRNGQTRTMNVQLAQRENAFRHWIAPVPPMPHVEIPRVNIPRFDFHFDLLGATRLGISGEDLTPQLARYFGVKQGKGVLVSEVMAGSPAEKAGLKAGDCVIKVGATEIDSVGKLRSALADAVDKAPNEKHPVTLTIVRDRHEQTVNVELDNAWHPSDQEVAELQMTPGDLDQYRALIEQLKTRDLQQQLRAAQKQMEDAKSELRKAMREQLTPEKQKALQDLRRELQNLEWGTSGAAI